MNKYSQILTHLETVDEHLTEYTAHNGNLCFRTSGDLVYYYYICAKFGLHARWTSGFSYEANEDDFGLDYVGGNIILWKKEGE